MAKEKKPLTPEQAEIKAMKKEKSSIGWTKFWAVFLALLLTVGVVFVGKTTADKAIEAAGQSVSTNGNENAPSGDVNAPSGDVNAPAGDENAPAGDENVPAGDENVPAGDENAPSGDANTPAGDANAPAADPKQVVVNAINAATAKAASGSYEFTRVCEFQPGKGISVKMLGGDATKVLNGVITAVDKNASLDSVVGGFLGRGTKKIKVTNGKGQRYGSDGTMAELTAEEKDYMLKATKLTVADVASATVNGNVYTFTLANIANPQKNNSNPMHKATNDFITESQVKTAIGNLTSAITVESADVNYNSIKFTATIENGTLKKLVMNYKADAAMVLKVALKIDGSGSLEVTSTYNF